MENEEIIENAKRISQKALDRGEELIPTCLAFRKDNAMEVIGVPFKNNKEKEGVRTFLKEHLTRIPIEKYAVIFDAKMTMWNQKNPKEEPKVLDTIIISVYTAQDKLTRIFPYYKDKKLVEKEMVEMKGRNEGEAKAYDCWDIWGEEVPITDNTEKYWEFKRTHRELYRGLEKEEDEIYDLKTKGKIEIFDMAFGHSLKIYRLNGKVLFEAINGKGEIFLSSKAMDDDNEFKMKLEEVKEVIKMVGEKLDEN
jgi:hypothetical protein